MKDNSRPFIPSITNGISPKLSSVSHMYLLSTSRVHYLSLSLSKGTYVYTYKCNVQILDHILLPIQELHKTRSRELFDTLMY